MNDLVVYQPVNRQVEILELSAISFLQVQDISSKTMKAYRKSVGYFIQWIKEFDVTLRSSDDIVRYKRHLQDRQLSSSTINAYMSAIRKLFEYLELKGISANLTRGIKNEKLSDGYKKKPLTPEELFRLKMNLSGSDLISRRDLLLIALGVGNGLRTIEMSRLRVSDIQEEQGHYVAMIEGKGSQNREKVSVILQDSTNLMIRQFIEMQGIGGNDFIFTSLSNNSRSQNKRLSTAGVRYAIKKRFREAGIEDPMKTAHSLRHTHAHKLFDVGASPLEIQTSLRHKSFSSTEIYIKSRSKHNNPASLKIDFLA